VHLNLFMKNKIVRTRPLFLLLGTILAATLPGCDRHTEHQIGDADLSIPFELERNRIILPVRFNRSPLLRIVLDTGMHFQGLLLYDKNLTDQLEPEDAIEVKVPGAGSGPPAVAVMADSASFFAGPVEFRDQRIIILQDGRMEGVPSDGVTGYSLFGNYIVRIDYDRMMIDLYDPEQFQPDPEKKWIPLTFRGNRIPWVEAAVSLQGEADIPVSMYIDLASGEALELLIREEMKYELPEDLEAVHLGTGLSGDIYGYQGRVASFRLGEFRLPDVSAAFAPGEVRSKQEGADGVIGNGLLDRFNLVFDYRNERLYLEPNDRFDRPFER
jgi:hypothetical protein